MRSRLGKRHSLCQMVAKTLQISKCCLVELRRRAENMMELRKECRQEHLKSRTFSTGITGNNKTGSRSGYNAYMYYAS